MQQTDKQPFMELMLAGCAVYDRKPMEKPALQMYWKLLERFSLDEVQAAMHRHMEASAWFPKPAELIAQIEGRAGENANNIWSQIITKLESGDYDLTGFDNRTVQALQSIGGIKQLGRTSYATLDFKRKAFIEAYEAADGAVNRGEIPAIPNLTSSLKLVGNDE